MGADLYIEKMPREAQYTGFRPDVEVGYYRDAYNSGNLLWAMGLSYWGIEKEQPEWFAEHEEGEGGHFCLTATGARCLLDLIESRRSMLEDLKPEVFKAFSDSTQQEVLEYFGGSYKMLVAFLKKAIELDSHVIWSV